MPTEPADPGHPMHVYVMGWLSGLLPKAWMTDQIKVSTAESLSDTTLLFTLSNGAAIRLGVEYLPPNPAISLANIIGVDPPPAVTTKAFKDILSENVVNPALTATDIAKAFNVPPALLGIDPGNGPSGGVEQVHPVPDVNKFQEFADKLNGLKPSFEKLGAAAKQTGTEMHNALEEYKAARQAQIDELYAEKQIELQQKAEYQGEWEPPPMPKPPHTYGQAVDIPDPGIEPSPVKKYKPVKWSPKASDFWMGVTDTTDAVDLADEVAQAPELGTAKQWIGQQAIKTKVQNWISVLNTLHDDYSFSVGTGGKKYQRVVAYHIMSTGQTSKSVHAFVDLSTGLVYKAATWKAPAAGPRYDLGVEASYQALMNDCDWAGSYLYQGQQSYTLPQST